MAEDRLRVAVIGHVEHVTIGRAARLPAPGDIVHFDEPQVIAGGGGGIAFFQLARSSGEVHLFTALGNDDAAAAVERRIVATGAHVHAARRDEPHTRDLAVVTDDGERTIFVIGRPLHPAMGDRLPWHVLASCDAAYFTGEDPETLRAAREARVLVVTARRAHVLAKAGVKADVVIGSSTDAREASRLPDYAVPPEALVMTAGRHGGAIYTADGVSHWDASPGPDAVAGSYGTGDTFAAALTWYLARGLSVHEACVSAAPHGAAVLRGVNPIEWQLPLE